MVQVTSYTKEAVDELISSADIAAFAVPSVDVSGVVPLSLDEGKRIRLRLVGDATLVMPIVADDGYVKDFEVTVTQDADGYHKLKTPSAVLTEEGQDFVIGMDPNSRTVIRFATDDGGATWEHQIRNKNLVKAPPRLRGLCIRTVSSDVRTFHTDHPARIMGAYIRWSDLETAPGVFSAAIDADIRDNLDDAHNEDYEVVVRVVKGTSTPEWIYDQDEMDPPAKWVAVLDNEQSLEEKVPWVGDSTYLARADLVDQHVIAILNEPCGVDPTHPRWHHVTMIPAATPTENGTEMPIGYSTFKCDYISPAAELDVTAETRTGGLTFVGDFTGWPDGVNALYRVGWVAADKKLAVSRFRDDFAKLVASGLGYSRQGFAWTQLALSEDVVVDVDAAGASFSFPANPASSKTAMFGLNDFKLGDLDVVFTGKIGVLPSAGKTTGIGVLFNYDPLSDDGEKYRVRIKMNQAGQLNTDIQRTSTVLATAPNTSLGITPGANTLFNVRIQRLNNANGTVQFRVKAWLPANPEPTAWALDIAHELSDPVGSPLVVPGAIGISAYCDAANLNATTNSFDSIEFSDPTGAEYVYGSLDTATGVFTPATNGRGWMGGSGHNHDAGALVEWVFAGTKTVTFEGRTGKVDQQYVNRWAWDMFGTEDERQVVYGQAWIDSIRKLAALAPKGLRIGLAGGGIFQDRWEDAHLVLNAVGPELGSRLVAMVTHWRDNFITAFPTSWTWLQAAKAMGCTIALQTQAYAKLGWSDVNPPTGVLDLVQAMEDAFVLFPDVLFLETAIARFTSAGAGYLLEMDTGDYGDWEDPGVPITQRTYLLSHANSVNERFV